MGAAIRAARDADASRRADEHALRRLLWRVRLGFAAWRSFTRDVAFRVEVARSKETRATLRATQDGVLLSLHREAFWRLIQQRPWLGINMLERLVRKLSRELDGSIDRRDDGDDATTPLAPYEHL